MAGSRDIYDPWSGDQGIFADEVHVSERPSHSNLLGPDGRPLAYEAGLRVGFDLSGSNKSAKDTE